MTVPCVRCQICGAERDGIGAGRHQKWTGHNCWELIIENQAELHAQNPTFTSGASKSGGIGIYGGGEKVN